MSTWIYEFRPGNKPIYVVFDEESEFSGPRTSTLSLDEVVYENVPYKLLFLDMSFLLISVVLILFRGYIIQTHQTVNK